MKNLNVHVIGSSIGYANWLLKPFGDVTGRLVEDIKSADIVVFTGGQDVHPKYYNRASNPSTSADDYPRSRDSVEWEKMTTAVEMRKAMWGTCRGLQLMCAFAGGDLIQHVSHPYRHEIQFYDGTIVTTNSIHHQMVYPFEKLKEKEDYHIVANSLQLSGCHQGENRSNLVMPVNSNGIILEPEAAFFPKINGFGQQSHLEMQDFNSPVVQITRRLVEFQLNGTLDELLTKGYSLQDVLKPSFNLSKIIKLETNKVG